MNQAQIEAYSYNLQYKQELEKSKVSNEQRWRTEYLCEWQPVSKANNNKGINYKGQIGGGTPEVFRQGSR